MATRLYFPSSGAAAVSPAYSATWTSTGSSFGRRAGVKEKIDSAFVDDVGSSVYANGSPVNSYCLNGQYVSGQLAAYDWTIADTIKLQIQGSEDGATNDYFLCAIIRVVSADGSTFRGILWSGVCPTEFASGFLINRSLGAAGASVTVQNSVSMQAGDRLVIELGAYTNTGAVIGWIFPHLRLGDDDATNDLPENETSEAAYCSWVEFSPTIADYSEHEDDEYAGSIDLALTPTAPTGDLWSDTLLKWCDEGKTSIGDVYLKGAAQPSFYLGLYNNAAEPDEDDVMTGIVEVETPGSNGYARIELADNEWTETSQGTFTNLQKTFTCATAAWADACGYFITTAATGTGGKLVTVEHFADGPYEDIEPGDTISVTPKLTVV